jgi:PPK2 family polyphosphate:nucleotide phosphotransferase
MLDFSLDTRFRVKKGKSFNLSDYDPSYTAGIHNSDEARRDLKIEQDQLFDLQEKLYAQKRHALIVIFQAMDAAGKDSTIKHVLSGLNQQGCIVTRFRSPSKIDVAHDFLWRSVAALPERGWIGIFNRSYYEDVLICKVRPEFILEQNLPDIYKEKDIKNKFWEKRYESIRNFEEHLVANGTIILKFFLHVSKGEQRKRLLERIDDPDKNWKFDNNDIKERELWSEYQQAYEDAIRETATPNAPWYVIPADNKWFTQMVVADIIRGALEALDLTYPKPDEEMEEVLRKARKRLVKE